MKRIKMKAIFLIFVFLLGTVACRAELNTTNNDALDETNTLDEFIQMLDCFVKAESKKAIYKIQWGNTEEELSDYKGSVIFWAYKDKLERIDIVASKRILSLSVYGENEQRMAVAGFVLRSAIICMGQVPITYFGNLQNGEADALQNLTQDDVFLYILNHDSPSIDVSSLHRLDEDETISFCLDCFYELFQETDKLYIPLCCLADAQDNSKVENYDLLVNYVQNSFVFSLPLCYDYELIENNLTEKSAIFVLRAEEFSLVSVQGQTKRLDLYFEDNNDSCIQKIIGWIIAEFESMGIPESEFASYEVVEQDDGTYYAYSGGLNGWLEDKHTFFQFIGQIE